MSKYQPYKQISCGCCTGDGSGVHLGNDQCTCWMHQDTPRGRPPHVCAHHARTADEAYRARPDYLSRVPETC